MKFAPIGLALAIAVVVCSIPLAVVAAQPQATAILTVSPDVELGAIKPMHAVNNGPAVAPVLGDQKRGNFIEYKAAKIPFARLHDSVGCVAGGAHAVDVNVVFPDFEADENDPKNYDFVFTDHYLDTIRRAGTKVFYRLGQTIEHGPKKYGVLPPKDNAKWARICEHIIRHYNEGWGWGTDTAKTTENIAWSNQFNIAYWEIWNEPDLDFNYVEPPIHPRTWGGTVTNFFELYTTAAKHLKSKFPHLKIGGPALCGEQTWAGRFLDYCRSQHAPLDFFSWHAYATEPADIAEMCDVFRKKLDERGFTGTESILNEWNYVKGWGDDFVYTLEVESGRFNQKGAAFIASTFVDCQMKPLDLLMFYDARANCNMNNLFDKTTLWPMKGYYPFYAWSKLFERGTQVSCSIKEGRGTRSNAATGVAISKDRFGAAKGQFRAVAAKGRDGSLAVFIARYSGDDNTTDTAKVWLCVPGVSFSRARCFMTDAVRTHTEVPLEIQSDGTALFLLQPNAFALIEW